MVLANLMFVIIGYLSIPIFAKIVTVKTGLLVPIVIMFAFAGAYVFRSSSTDLLMLVAFGLFGLLARAGRFGVMPMVMGFILGEPLEYAFGQTMAMASVDPLSFFFTERLGMVGVLVATPIIGFYLWRRMQTATAA